MIRWMLIALMLAGCAGPQFSTTCTLPPLSVRVYSAAIPAGSVDRVAGKWVTLTGRQEKDGKVIDFHVAGHELQHLLQVHCQGFKDPDK